MKRILSSVRWVFPLAIMLAVPNAQAALDMFLEAGHDIQGETKDKEFGPKHAMDVLAWSWSETNAVSSRAGGGAGAGKVTMQDLSVTKYVDTASTALMRSLARGTHIPQVKLTMRRSRGGPGEEKHYLELTMTDVLVTRLTTGASGGEDRLTEEVAFHFEKVKFEYFTPGVDGETTLPTEDLMGTKQDRPALAAVPKLLANDRSSVGGTLRITGVASHSSAGGTVVLNGPLVTYTPPASFVGLDQWTYSVTDGRSTAQGTVKVVVTSAAAQTHNAISIVANAGANFIQFAGVPGATYHVEGAEQISGPWFDLSGPIRADASGLIVFNHLNPPASQFYRTQLEP